MEFFGQIHNELDRLGVAFRGSAQEGRKMRSVRVEGPKGRRLIGEFVNTDGSDQDIFVTTKDGRNRDAELADIVKLTNLTNI